MAVSERKYDKAVKASSFTALAWTWFTFREGWLFGHFLGWIWAGAWCGSWVVGRAMYEWGRKSASAKRP
jgi:hypothetical protein